MTHIIKREEHCLTIGLHLAAQDLSRNVSGADADKDLTSFFTVLVSKTKHEKRVQKLDSQPVGFLYVLFRKQMEWLGWNLKDLEIAFMIWTCQCTWLPIIVFCPV